MAYAIRMPTLAVWSRLRQTNRDRLVAFTPIRGVDMNRTSTNIAVILLAIASSSSILQAQPVPLADMKVPTMKVLLERHQDPDVDVLDWIVLQNDDVLEVKSVAPRPGTIEKRKAEADAELRKPVNQRDIDLVQEYKQKLPVTLPDDAEESLLDYAHIKEIIYHEDLMMKRIDLQLKSGELRLAYELLLVLNNSSPEWPGLKQRLNAILFRESEIKFQERKTEEALVSIDLLYQQDKAFPGLRDLAGKAFGSLITPAYNAKDYPRIKHYMSWFQKLDEKNPEAISWSNKLTQTSAALFDRASVEAQAGRHPEASALARESAKVWSVPADRRDAQQRMLARFQQLRVAVTRFPGEPTVYPFETRDDIRVRSLTEASLFGLDQYSGADTNVIGYFQTPFFEQWDPADLGRRTLFTLRQRPNYWESQPLVTSSMVIDSIESRISPDSPEYDERLASFVKQIEVRNPFEFEVRFNRVPLRLEALFDFPITRFSRQADAAPAGADAVPADASADRKVSLVSQKFQPMKVTADQIIYRRSTPEPDNMPEYHVAEIVETKYEDTERATQALLRGDADFLPRIMPWNVDALSTDPRLYVRKYSVPTTHILQFNPKSDISSSRELRRGLAFALNRDHFLKVALKNRLDMGRLSTSPFPMSSYATNPIVGQRKYDIYLGLALTIVGKSAIEKKREAEEQELLTLRMLCPPDSVCIAAAEEMKKLWERTKRLKVELIVDGNGQNADDWDIIYRKVQLSEPLMDIWPFITLQDRARVEDLTFLPDWLRAEFVKLDTSTNFKEARTRVWELHRHLWSEAFIIPLWEIDEYMAFRRDVRQTRTRPISAYDGVTEWYMDVKGLLE